TDRRSPPPARRPAVSRPLQIFRWPVWSSGREWPLDFLSTGAQRTLETADAARLDAPFFSSPGETLTRATLNGAIADRCGSGSSWRVGVLGGQTLRRPWWMQYTPPPRR